MQLDINLWRASIIKEIEWLSDAQDQREVWSGHRPGHIDSPDETINRFLGDLNAEKFVERTDTGLTQEQLLCAKALVLEIRHLCDETPEFLPLSFIDDPRWRSVQAHAKRCIEVLGY